jgi:hypothetical protein
MNLLHQSKINLEGFNPHEGGAGALGCPNLSAIYETVCLLSSILDTKWPRYLNQNNLGVATFNFLKCGKYKGF